MEGYLDRVSFVSNKSRVQDQPKELFKYSLSQINDLGFRVGDSKELRIKYEIFGGDSA